MPVKEEDRNTNIYQNNLVTNVINKIIGIKNYLLEFSRSSVLSKNKILINIRSYEIFKLRAIRKINFFFY